MRNVSLILLVLLAGLSLPAGAGAAYPGRNGLIAFSACAEPTLRFPWCDGEIWTIEPDGTSRRQVTDFYWGTYAAAWTPDGDRLALGVYFGESYAASRSVFSERTVGNGDRAETFESVTKLADGNKYDHWGLASWSPDGRSYVIAHGGGFGERENKGLFIVERDGTKRQLTDSGRTLNPDGTYTPKPDGFGDHDPVWAPDGSLIAFVRTTWRESAVVETTLMAIDPSSEDPQPRPIVRRSDLPIGAVDWAPDSSRLTFSTGTSSGGRDNLTGDGIWAVRPDGSQLRRLYPSGYSPAFSPDGTKIVFSKYDGLYVMPAAGGAEAIARRIHVGYNDNPDWQPVPVIAAPPSGTPTPPPALPAPLPPSPAPPDSAETPTSPAPAARRRPLALSVRVQQLPRRRLRVTGRLTPPAGVSAAACSGHVRIKVRHNGRALASERTRLRADCSYTTVLGLRSTRRAHGVAVISVRFLGNGALRAHKAPLTRIRLR